jgi:hypothetical protein
MLCALHKFLRWASSFSTYANERKNALMNDDAWMIWMKYGDGDAMTFCLMNGDDVQSRDIRMSDEKRASLRFQKFQELCLFFLP